MDAKAACDKLNGFNFQSRYLVGRSRQQRSPCLRARTLLTFDRRAVLYHQPEKMQKAAQDLAERQENLEKLKREHGID